MNTKLQSKQMPQFIYGTAWKEEETKRLTREAIEAGFRAIDTANQRKHYFEAGVGQALGEVFDEGLVDRDELFVQTKFTYLAGQDDRLPYDAEAPADQQVEQSFASSLEHLGVEFIDSYVLHGPSMRSGLADVDHQVWEKMEELFHADKVGVIGISNVSAGQLETLIDFADVGPAYVQNRCFAKTGWDRAVREICEANDVVYQGFSLLTANRRELGSPEIVEIAKRHGRTIPQVVFRFAMQVGMVPLTGTTDVEHMKEDLACVEFELSEEEMEVIEG